MKKKIAIFTDKIKNGQLIVLVKSYKQEALRLQYKKNNYLCTSISYETKREHSL